MSQQIPYPPVPQERNIYVKYQQVLSRTNNNVRSGIIERYTYKTDNGKLLSSTSLNKNYNGGSNECTESASAPQNIGTLQGNTPSVSRTTIIKTNVSENIEKSLRPLPTKHHVTHQNVTLLKLGNSSQEDENKKVRTEHCDSTTDIIENMERETMNILQHEIKLFSDDDYYERYKTFSPSRSDTEDIYKLSTSPQQSCEIDSDSDCQIVDVTLHDNKDSIISNKDRFSYSQDKAITQNPNKTLVSIDNFNSKEESPNTKVFSWISCKLAKPEQSTIHVISDSEEENDGSETFLCDKTGMEKPIKEILTLDNDCKCNDCKIEDQQSNNICSLLPPSVTNRNSPDLSVSLLNVSSKIPDTDSVVLINSKYQSVINHFSPDKKNICGVVELNQQNLLLKPESPKMCSSVNLLNKTPPKRILGNRLEITPPKIQKLNIQIQKMNSQLSPESMKSEFYSYLKINTNPLAQKAETVAQNRRSIRVKNLIQQIEKNKELENKSTINDKSKKNDVRKKFMKYSKFNLVFPPPQIQHNKISDFNQSIEAYFLKEKMIQYKCKLADSIQINNEERYSSLKSEVIKTRTYRTSPIDDSIQKNKYICKKTLLEQSLKRQLKQNKETNYSSQFFADKKLRRLQYGPNRILRNTAVRITRNSLDGCKLWNTKMLKSRKAKLKAKLKAKMKQRYLNITAEEETEDKLKITVKQTEDKMDLLNILPRKLPESIPKPELALNSLFKQLEKNSQQQSSFRTENYSITHLESTESKLNNKVATSSELCHTLPVDNSKSIETPKFVPYTPMYGAETEKRFRMFCHSTPVYKSESEKEIEFIACSSQDTIIKDNYKLSENCNSARKGNVSPPFLGFTTNENKKHQNIQNLATHLSLTQETLKGDTNIDIQEKHQGFSNIEQHDIISISSSENDTHMDEDSNSEEFSETSSLQEEMQMNIQEVVDTNLIESGNPNYIPLNQNIKAKSFHKSLMQSCVKRKSTLDARVSIFELSDSDSSMSTPKTSKGNISKRSQTHEIDINKNNGAVFNTYYINAVLIIVQEHLITFWKQTALGNILGVQNMWVPHGSIQRIILDPGCVNRRSSEMVMSCDNSVAYVELWTKEHKCMYRECPIADVFATIYFHKGHGLPDKKVLQLENIKGYGDDVRFAVIKNSREIIVSWCDTVSKPVKTLVRSYQLASDFQTVASIKEMEFVSHYISSLHNINDCDDLVLGAGNEQISVWNLHHGYLVTTLDLSETPGQSYVENKTICLYVQCHTGFLFLIQQSEVGILRLVAVNGMTQEWKQLHSYQVPDNYKKLLGVIVESGVLMTCYTNGFLCWNMHSGEVLAEIDTPNELIVLPSNKYLVAIDNYQVTVQHIMSYILTHDW